MIFRVTRVALVASVVLTGIAMSVYPGGTFIHRSSHGYSFSENSLSDLGSTVAWNGQANPASPFHLGACILLVVAGCTCLLALVRVYASSVRARRLARAGGIAVVVAGAALLGAALAPQDRQPALHGRFSLLAIGSFPIGTALLAAATALDTRFHRRVPIGWSVLTLSEVAWASTIFWRHTAPDLQWAIPVMLQKVVATTLVATLVFQSYEAQRVAMAGAPPTTAG